MAKIIRKNMTVFGLSGATSNFEQFGSKKINGTPNYTKDVEVIQGLSAYQNGWQDAVALNNAPYIQDMNALQYVFSYQSAYLLQEGIAEYNSSAVYYIGSIVKNPGTFELYGSKIDSNTGNTLPSQVSDSNWYYLGNLTSLPTVGRKYKNYVINAQGRVKTVRDYTLANNVYGQGVDYYEGTVSATGVTNGTITNTSNSPVGISGYAVLFNQVTTTGSTSIKHRYRIQSLNAVALKNQTCCFSLNTYHDVGSPIDYTIYVRKANSKDDFTSVTAIDNSGAISVSNTTGTNVKFEGVLMGDCSNGVEVEIIATCSAITLKSFYFTDLLVEIGLTATVADVELIETETSQINGWISLGRVVLTAPATSITFDNLNGNKDIFYKFIFKSVNAQAGSPGIRINNDTGSNYSQLGILTNGTTINYYTGTTTYLNIVSSSSTSIADFIDGTIDCNIGGINRLSTFFISGVRHQTNSGYWDNNTDNITSLTFLHTGAGGLGVGSYIELYTRRTEKI